MAGFAGSNTMAAGLSIGRAAQRAGVGVETIRFYERRGLIQQPPRPRGGGIRYYGDDVIERIRFIRQAQELGFSLREIAELFSLRADPGADCADVRMQAVIKRDEVDRKLAQLAEIRAALDRLIATCPGSGALRSCTIMDALGGRRNAGAGGLAPQRKMASRKPRARKARDVKTATFRVFDMHCEGCVQTIRFVLGRQAGIRNAAVSLRKREARISYEPEIVDKGRLADIIARAGFRVAVPR
jgi:MerR family copper efflux transcriptional regulator